MTPSGEMLKTVSELRSNSQKVSVEESHVIRLDDVGVVQVATESCLLEQEGVGGARTVLPAHGVRATVTQVEETRTVHGEVTLLVLRNGEVQHTALRAALEG